MDIVLERILSLIPKKPDGKYVHGAKKKFAESLGFSGGEIVTMWISGSSDSYKNYLYQISALYNVSVEWLKGETDDPGIKKSPVPGGTEDMDAELFEIWRTGDAYERQLLLDMARSLERQRKKHDRQAD